MINRVFYDGLQGHFRNVLIQKLLGNFNGKKDAVIIPQPHQRDIVTDLSLIHI